MQRHALWTAFFGVLTASAMLGCPGAPPRTRGLENIALTERGAEDGGDFCADFDLDPEGVRAFFERAQTLDPPSLHAQFDHLPCFVRGTATWNGVAATWEIRAGGTGSIQTEDGRTLLFGCANCDDLFGGAP